MTLHLGNDCPDGLQKIFDNSHCEHALRTLNPDGGHSPKVESLADWPAGCYLCSNTPDCNVSVQSTNHAQPCANMHDGQLACLQDGTYLNKHSTGSVRSGVQVESTHAAHKHVGTLCPSPCLPTCLPACPPECLAA